MTVAATPHASAVERKRWRILDAAGNCFAQLGFAKATVEEIAREAGVSKGLLYVHFDGKEGLLEAVLSTTLDQWHDETWAEMDAVGDSVVEKLETMHRASIEFAQRHPLLRRILERDVLLVHAIVEEPARRATERWARETRELMQTGIERGELRDDVEVDHLVEVFRLLHLSYLDRLFEGDLIGVSDPKLIEAGARLLLEGIAAKGERP